MGPGKLLRSAIEGDQVSSILLYGPPGCGKTTLAHIISKRTQGDFVKLNAVEASVKDVRAVIDQAKMNKSMYGRKTILFLDEVHRFNSFPAGCAAAGRRARHHRVHRRDDGESVPLCERRAVVPFDVVPAWRR